MVVFVFVIVFFCSFICSHVIVVIQVQIVTWFHQFPYILYSAHAITLNKSPVLYMFFEKRTGIKNNRGEVSPLQLFLFKRFQISVGKHLMFAK